MSVQIYVNMLSAVIIFVGGMIIAIFYPGHLTNQYRILVALAVLLYFLLRMGQTFFLIKRERRREREGSDEVAKNGERDRT